MGVIVFGTALFGYVAHKTHDDVVLTIIVTGLVFSLGMAARKELKEPW